MPSGRWITELFGSDPCQLCVPLCVCVQGKLSSQGKLLEQDTFGVLEQDGGVLSRSKERRIFLFEHIVIFSEILHKGSTPGYLFKHSIKVNSLAMQDSVEGDQLQFVLWCRGSEERFTLQAPSPSVRTSWLEQITQLLETQRDFLSGPPLTVGDVTQNEMEDWYDWRAQGALSTEVFSKR
ncbi:Kalirin [Merluccius polli]|uniref:Kalirin n=1 Tax=Merluccius polli TaxID=89951 RepID=A0AA47M0F6_MERPO|nr:Kalirin [Merluccius polli]